MDVPLTRELAFLVEYLDLPEAVGDPSATWETFQLRHLNNTALLGIALKSRQVGESWLFAAESIASACLNPRTPHLFVSINQEEAGEKVRYAKAILEALDAEVRPKLIIDNRLELELENGSRLISHPCRAVRGKAKAKIYLDEFAHYPNDREIYQSAIPIISKGGFVRIGSSPLGAQGMFWEIYTQSLRKYPGYARWAVPWWSVRALCKDVKMAEQIAMSMTTDERVQTFGTERLFQIYENVPLDDFQQEFECAWLDEAVSFIDWNLIKRNQVLAAQEKHWYKKVRGVDQALQAINDVREASTRARIEPAFIGGMDIGRTKDTTEIILLGQNPYSPALPYRLGITLDRVEFEEQKNVVSKLLSTLPITGFLIDRSGIGMNLAEDMSKKFPAVQGVDFTNSSKQLWAIETKLRFERGEIPIPLERELMYQIHSIKRKVTEGKSLSFDTSGNEKHHADMFWALALALWSGKTETRTATVGRNPFKKHRG